MVGEMSGPKPTFVLEKQTVCIPNQNVFINLHFKLQDSQMNIMSQEPESSILFLHCKFESNSPIDPTTPEKLKEVDEGINFSKCINPSLKI